jgi:DNA mismatch repair protein MutS
VVRAAKKHLSELESQLRPGGAQPDLFTQPGAHEAAAMPAALAALHELAPDELSPKEALETLYRLKRLLDE